MNDDAVYTVQRGTYHAIARCINCKFVEEDYRAARLKGLEHCLETGHLVYMETGELLTRNNGVIIPMKI